MTLRVKSLLAAGTIASSLIAAPAFARTEITPYLEASQVVVADLKNDDVLTYSSIAAGVDATVQTSRTQAQVAYRYERRIGWGQRLDDGDVHSGLARVSHELVNNTLNIEAGALATRARGDIRGAAPGLLVGDVDNVSQVYSAYAGPTLSTNVGQLQVNAAYRLGYTKVEATDFVAGTGQPQLDSFDDSIQHQANVSVGMAPGTMLPFGWTVSGAYEREDAGQLDQRFEAKGVRGDIIYPVTPTIALLAGAGYEDIQASQRPPVFDATGNPVVDSKGRFVTDKTSPRAIAYDFDGIYWDVGVAWKPSRRTNLEAHVGRRYGSMSYTGSFSWAPTNDSSLQIGVYDQVQTFGQQLNDALSNAPTAFGTNRNALANPFGGCVLATSGDSPGSCFNNALQSVNGAVYRGRGASALYSASRGKISTSVGAGYSQRTYSVPGFASGFSLDGVKDESYYGFGNVGYRIDDRSSLDGSFFASLSDSGIAGAPNVLSTGATGAYNRTFGRRLSATAAIGVYHYEIDGLDSQTTASALVGMRYSF